MTQTLNIAVACGGTGGHVFPGMAAAEALAGRGHRVKLWLTGRDIEQHACRDWEGSTVCVPVGTHRRCGWLRLPGYGLRLLKALRQARQLLNEPRPDAMLAMGSYASVAPVLAARCGHVPVVLHEANAVPGRAASLLARFAAVVAVNFPETVRCFGRRRVVRVGFPLRRDLTTADRAAAVPLFSGAGFTLLVAGGSQGAHRLNEIVPCAVCRLYAQGHALRVVHLAGAADERAVKRAYETAGVPHAVFAFCTNMSQAYAGADLAVSRAGAASCAELLACGVPALLVPLPTAVRDHQTANAMAVKRLGAAEVVAQRDLSADFLADYLAQCVARPESLARMRAAALAAATCNAAEALADVVERTARAGSSLWMNGEG